MFCNFHGSLVDDVIKMRLKPVLLLAATVATRSYRGGAASSPRGGRGGYRGRGGAPPRSRRPPPVGDNFGDGMDFEGDDFVEDDLGEPFDALYGVSPILSALRTQRRTLKKLWFQDSLDVDKRNDRPALREIETLAHAAGVPIGRLDKGTLNSMCRNRPHQGIVLEASPLEFEPLQALPRIERQGSNAPLWLALDEVSDPQNLGALLRSAFFLGVDGVLVSAKNTCSLTPTVSKSSAGAMELSTVYAARNLPRTLEAAREDGWQVVGAALEQSVAPSELDHDVPTVLVLGSEGHGLRTNVLRACTSLVRIPRGASAADEAELVDSLNVSVAGGILLYSLVEPRRAKIADA